MAGRPCARSFRQWLARFLNPKPTHRRPALRLRTRPQIKSLESRVLPDAAPTEFFNFAALDGRWRTAPAASGDTTGVTDTTNLQNALNTVGTGLSIISATESGNTVTVTTATPHGFRTKDWVAISFVNVGNNPIPGYDGVFQVTVTDPTHFTYYDYNTGLANTANGGTASRPNVLVLSPGTYYINQTLTFDNRASSFVYGSDPGTTIIKWVGPADGTMFEMFGCHYAAVDRLTFDGAGQADVGIWNALNKSNNDGSVHYDGANEYADDVFQNLGIGLSELSSPLGSGGGGPGEFDISRDRFIHCTTAGIDLHGQNTLDQWVRDCQFMDCAVGISSHDGFGGNWSVSDCVFLNSTIADVTTGIPQYWLISGCYSRGSNAFLQANADSDDITIQNTTIIDPTGAGGAPINAAHGGSNDVLLLGDTIRTPAGYAGPMVTVGDRGLVFADANTFGVDGGAVSLATYNPYGTDPYYPQYADALNTVIDRSRVSDPGPPALPPTPTLIRDTNTWHVITVGATQADSTVANAVSAAVAYATTTGPVVVHIPEGVYLIGSTVTIPSTKYPIELVGDGQYIDPGVYHQPGINGTRLLAAGGLGANPEIKLTGPSLVAISQMSVYDGNANGISIQMTGVDGVAGSTVTTNYVGTGYNTGAGLLVNGQGSNLYVQNQDFGTTALFGGGWAVQVVNGAAQVADFFGNDGGARSYDVENGGRLLVAGQYIDSDNGAQYAQVNGGTLTVESGLTRLVEPVRNLVDAAGSNTSVTLIGEDGSAGDGVNVQPGATANVLVAANVLDERYYGGSTLADYAGTGTLRAAVLENTYVAGGPRGGSLNQWTANITDLAGFVHQQLAAVYAARPAALSDTWHGALTGHGNGSSDVRLRDIGVGSSGGNPANAYGIVIGSTTISPPPLSPVVQDGGFEVPPGFHTDPPGTPWTYTGSAGVVPNGNATYTGGNGPAPDGGQVGFFQDNATASQSVTVGQAGWYTLSLLTAQSAPQVGHGSQTLNVYVDGNLVGSVTPGGTAWQVYTTNPFQLTTTGSHTLELAGTAGGGPTALVDVVTLTPGVADAPMDLTATPAGSPSAAVTVSWSAPLRAVTDYTLYRGTSPGTETVYQTGLTGTSYTDTGVAAGTTYYYKLAAVNAAGASATFGEVSAAPGAVPDGWAVAAGASADNSGGVGGTWVVRGPGNNSTLNYVYDPISATATTVLKARVTGVTTGAEAGLMIQGSGGNRTIYVSPSSNVPGIYGQSGNHSDWPSLSRGDVWLAVEVYPANGQIYYYELYSVDGGNTWLAADTYPGDGFGTITGWTNLKVGFVLARSGNPSVVTATFDSVTVGGTALLTDRSLPLGGPTNLTAAARGNGVALSWSAPFAGNVSHYDIYRSASPTRFDLSAPYDSTPDNRTTSYTDTDAPAGVAYYYWVTAVDGAFESAPAAAAPNGTMPTASAVSGVAGGNAQRSNATGWYGARITIGGSDLVVAPQYTLARWGATTGQTPAHMLEFVDAAVNAVIGTATNSVGGSGGPGFLYWWTLSAPVTLLAGHSYYLVSFETNGGDNWLDPTATVPPVSSSVLTVDGPVSSTDNATWSFTGNVNHEWVGLDFRYTIEPAADLVTGVTPGSTTAGADAWAGAVIQVGSANLTVTSLGRLVADGNTQTHTVELVDGANNAVLGSVSVDTSGAAAGRFLYAPLAAAVTLLAGHTYYVVSQEFGGGDSFYSQPAVATTSAAADLGGVSSVGASLWNWTPRANTQTVGVDFRYTLAPPTAPTNLAATARTDARAINLSWAPSVGGVTAYSIYRGTSPGTETPIAGAALTGYTDAGLTPGTTYYYKVLAYRFTPDGGLLASPLSGEVRVTVNDGTTLAAPTDVTATADRAGRIIVSWAAVSGATGYNIYRTTTSLGSTTGGVLDNGRLAVAPYKTDVSGTGFTDDNLLPGTTYYYRVTAIEDSGGNVYESGFLPAAPVAAPPNGATESGHTVTITTTSPHGFSVGQVVRVGGVGVGGYNGIFTITAVPTPTSFQYTDPAAGLGNSGGGAATATEVEATTATTTDWVTGLTFHQGVRNDLTGWVGGNFTLNADIKVYALGRYVVPGNTRAHTVELVDFTGGGNTVVARVTVDTLGATPGQIAYAALASPVALVAGHTYRLASSETRGGDSWYDYATQLTTTAVASETSGIFRHHGTRWHHPGRKGTRAGQQFTGLDFRYKVRRAAAADTARHAPPVADRADAKRAPVAGPAMPTWAASGPSADQAALLGHVHFVMTDLPAELPVGVQQLPVGSTTPVAEGRQLPAPVPSPVDTEGASVSEVLSAPSDCPDDAVAVGPVVPDEGAADAAPWLTP